MIRVMVSRCQVLALVMGLFAAAAQATPPAAGWAGLADPVFQPVARNVNLPGLVLPVSVAQDKQGFIWGGGETGLVRWDGYHFRYYAEGGAADGLADHDVHTLHRASDGTLWVGTAAGGLARYDPATDHFTTVALEPGNRDALRVEDMTDDGAGGLWVITGAGLYHVGAGGRAIGNRLRRQDLRSLCRDAAGGLWVGTTEGLLHSPDAGAHFTVIDLAIPGGRPAQVDYLMAGPAGRVWIGSRQDGLYLVMPGEAQARPVPMAGVALPGGHIAITGLAQINPSTIWVATRGQGLVAVDTASLATRQIPSAPAIEDGLPSQAIYALYPDSAGLVWVSTSRGLRTFNSGATGLYTLFGDVAGANRLNDENIWATSALPGGAMLAGLESHGLAVADPGTGLITGVPGMAGKSVLAMDRAPHGGLLAATLDGEIYWTPGGPGGAPPDLASAAFTKLVVPGGPRGNLLYTMRVIDGSIWFGGVMDGVWQIGLSADGPATVLRHVTAPVLTDASVRVVAPGPGGLIAIGSDHGFTLLDPRTGAVRRILPDPGNPIGLAGPHVNCFTVDRAGRLWVGMDNAGLDVLTGEGAGGKPIFRHLTRADGLPSNTMDTLLVDSAGRIWVSTDGGLALIDPTDFAVRAFTGAHGLAVLTYWTSSGAISSAGDLAFGGIGGMTVVTPGALPPPLPSLTAVVTDVTLGGVALPASRWHDAAGVPRVRVQPRDKNLTVIFSALDFAAPDQDRYSYQLDGFDHDWIEADAPQHSATYTNLPPGKYSLLIRAADSTGNWSAHITRLDIEVLPAWYQTTWLRLTLLGLAVLAIVGLVQGRTLYLRQRQRELERLVAQRTAELQAGQQQLARLAFLDGLTGLANRRAFTDAFDKVMAAPPPGAALLLLDLDGFKSVNDNFGHVVGDDVLVAAGARLRDAVGAGDLVARLGGDEFAILLGDVSQADAVGLCARLVSAMAQPMVVRGSRVEIGVSLGATRLAMPGATAESCYRQADHALYEAKRAGRNTWRWAL